MGAEDGGFGLSTTLATLRSDARLLADSNNTTRLSDAQLDRLIQLALSSLAGILARAGDTSMVDVGSTTIVGPGRSFELTALSGASQGIASILSVWWRDGGSGSRMYQLEHRRREGQPYVVAGEDETWSRGNLPTWWIQDGQMHFHPGTVDNAYIEVVFRSAFQGWTLGTGSVVTFYLQPEWADFVAHWVASRLAIRDRELRQALRAQLLDIKADIIDQAGDRVDQQARVRKLFYGERMGHREEWDRLTEGDG